MKVVALAGGVGGAKLANGFARLLPHGDFSVIVNTGDDFVHAGLYICPDIDTVTYTLAGLNNPFTGWGRKDETWNVMKTRESLGYPVWFKLGDKDLALHLERTRLHDEGKSLTQITRYFVQKFNIPHEIFPMSNERVKTIVNTCEMGKLAFQEYFVKYHFKPKVVSIAFDGIESAHISKEVKETIQICDLVVICPSNPFVSIYPILSISGMENLLQQKLVIAVSPIIGGKAVKGPAAKMFTELGLNPSSGNVARFYRGLIRGFVLDTIDRADTIVIDQWGIISLVTDTLMADAQAQTRLAGEILKMGKELQGNRA